MQRGPVCTAVTGLSWKSQVFTDATLAYKGLHCRALMLYLILLHIVVRLGNTSSHPKPSWGPDHVYVVAVHLHNVAVGINTVAVHVYTALSLSIFTVLLSMSTLHYRCSFP
jgi:hypothetical protein